MKNWKKAISLILALCMFVTLLPLLSVQAEAVSVSNLVKKYDKEREQQGKAYIDDTGWYWPLGPDGSRSITSLYGYRNLNYKAASKWHPAIDIGAKKNDKVYASKDGVVIAAVEDSKSSTGCGTNVRIYHGKDSNGTSISSAYYHLNSIEKGIESGTYVRKGQLIGRAGKTGASTGVHLDFRICYGTNFPSVNKDTIAKKYMCVNPAKSQIVKNASAANKIIKEDKTVPVFYETSKSADFDGKNYHNYGITYTMIACEHKSYDSYGLCTFCREPDPSKCVTKDVTSNIGYYTAAADSPAVTIRTTPYDCGGDNANVVVTLAAGEIAYIHTVKSMTNSFGKLWYEADTYMTKSGVEHKGRFFIYFKHLQTMEDPTKTGMILFNIKDPVKNQRITANSSHKLYGTIISMAGFTSIEGKITNASKTYSYTQHTVKNPVGTRFTINGTELDNKLKFSKVEEGACFLTYTVTDKKGNVQSIEIPFVATTDGWPNLSIVANSENIVGGKRLTFTAYRNGTVATDATVTVVQGEFLEQTGTGSCTIDVTNSGAVKVSAEAKKCNSVLGEYPITVDQTPTPEIHDPIETDAGSEVSITCESEAEIYYRLDNGTLLKYEKPFILEQDTTVTAYATCLGSTDSAYTSRRITAALPRDPVLTADKTVAAQGTNIALFWTPTLGAEEYQVWTKYEGGDPQLYTTTKSTSTSIRLEEAGQYVVYVTADAREKTFHSNELSLDAKADCQVLFYDVNKEVMYMQTVKWSDSVTPPEVPAVRGYNFTGWEDSASLARITQDTAFYAKYSPISYRVRFYGFDGELLDTQRVNYGSAAIAPAPGTCRAGCVFAGWNVMYAKENDSKCDPDYVDSDLDLQAVQIWENADLPVLITGVTALYNSSAGTYSIQVQMTNGPTNAQAALLRATIENRDGQMLRTGSMEYAIVANGSQEVNMTIKYPDPASVVKVYVLGIDEEGRTTGTLAAEYRATVTQNAGEAWTPFSDWSETAVQPSENCEVETKTQYASRTMQTTNSSSETLSGWERAGTSSVVWSGVWSDWSTTAVSASDTLQVETKQVAATTKTQYLYRRYVGTYGSNKSYTHFCPDNKYIVKSTQKDHKHLTGVVHPAVAL